MSIHTNHIGKLLILGLTVLCTACVSGTKSSSTSSAPPTTTEWTWVSGSSTCCAFGSYGTLGVAAAGNVPGARYSAVSWIDGSGHLWLFGGNGLASVGGGNLNDLWKFDGANWTWVSGSNAVGAYGSYSGTLMPGARYGALSWIDSGGKLWLFGGNGLSTGGFGYLNDLWKFAGGQWNWMSGSSMINAVGVYGTIDTPASGNVPGARYGAVSWIDSAGNLWLFGGAGYPSAGSPGYLNDLWKFDGTYWTWVSGSNTANASGVYGASGTAASGNVPGARYQAVSWIDGNGQL